MKPLKILLLVLAGIVGLLVIAAVLLLVFVDPNDYRDEIEQAVESRTGRELTLEGDLSLSIFPWLAVEVGRAQLGDAPAFGPEPFIAIERAKLGVRLLPLLSGAFEVGDIVLEGPRIRLVTTEAGNNWDDLGTTAEPAEPSAEPDTGLKSLSVAGLVIRDGEIVVIDRTADSTIVLTDLDLKTGRLTADEPFDVEGSFDFEQAEGLGAEVELDTRVTLAADLASIELAEPRIVATVRGEGFGEAGMPVQLRAEDLTVMPEAGRYALTTPRIEVTLKGEGLPADGVPATIAASRIAVDTSAGTASMADLEIALADARITGELEGANILDAPAFSGPIALAPVSLRSLLPQLGIEVPETSDDSALERVSFEGRVEATPESAQIENLALVLDDTRARGRLAIANFERQALRFDLEVDRIDLDRYLPPESTGDATETDDVPAEIPVDLIRSLDLAGELSVGEAVLSGMTLSGLRVGVRVQNGKVRVNPAEAALFGGRYQGNIGLDASGDVPQLSMNERVTGIDFAPLFANMFETDRVSGTGNATAQVTAQGRTTDAMIENLAGEVGFDVENGAFEGVDLWYEIRRARALIDRAAVPTREGPARTPFRTLEGSGTIREGVLANDDLRAALDYLRVTGRGTVDLAEATLDYGLVAQVLRIPPEGADQAGVQDLVEAEIPVSVTGSLTDPKVRPDVESYLKGRAQQVIDEEAEKLEDKLKDKLREKLPGILGGDR